MKKKEKSVKQTPIIIIFPNEENAAQKKKILHKKLSATYQKQAETLIEESMRIDKDSEKQKKIAEIFHALGVSHKTIVEPSREVSAYFITKNGKIALMREWVPKELRDVIFPQLRNMKNLLLIHCSFCKKYHPIILTRTKFDGKEADARIILCVTHDEIISFEENEKCWKEIEAKQKTPL